MSEITDQTGGKSLKLTGIGGVALALIVMQFVAFGAIMDIVMSAGLFGIGYIAGRYIR